MPNVTCKYCGTVKYVNGGGAKNYKTCGQVPCKIAYRAEYGHGNSGKTHSAKVNAAKGRPGRAQSQEHVDARMTARRAQNPEWFQIPDIGERISAGRKAGFETWPEERKEALRKRMRALAFRRWSLDNNRGTNWRAARLDALVRDNFTCQRCEEQRTWKLVVHHIEGYRTEEDNILSNLLTLCRRCHARLHRSQKPPESSS